MGDASPGRPSVLEPLFDYELDREGFRCRAASIGAQAGAERLGASLYEVEPGQASCPYHWHAANEELLLMLDGRVELRTPDGVREIGAGEVVAFPLGERGAHQLVNGSDRTARFLIVSEMNYPEVCGYPDSGKVGVRERHPDSDGEGLRLNLRIADAVDYWDGEAPPR